MKAIVYRHFGSPDVLRCEEVDQPVPRDGEVLIQVHAAGLNPLDWRLMEGDPSFVRLLAGREKLKRPGRDVAGLIEAVGAGVTPFKPGDAVFGTCRGALAEFVCTPASAVAMKPENVTFEQAASVPVAAFTALQGLRDKGHVQPGQKVLINGAAGGVGTFAVQLAKYYGAEVTGVCSTRNGDLVRSIGADRVIDYTQEDFAAGHERYDAILDCHVNHALSAVRRVLKPRGAYVIIGGPSGGSLAILGGMVGLLVLAPFTKQKLGTMMARANQADLNLLGELMQSGKVMPVMDRCYTLGEAADAMRYLEQGHARGKVVVTVP